MAERLASFLRVYWHTLKATFVPWRGAHRLAWVRLPSGKAWFCWDCGYEGGDDD